ncbi:MAG TPA: glycosyltransferase family 2 protein [Candidatus Tumulicola sp.]|jgi:cellulose synthase/poly-beta-1,6-N-acetylglucosamine synthase-like glycosyltransferase
MTNVPALSGRVALIPCFNEGDNPRALVATLSTVDGLDIVLIDDAGDDAESLAVLAELDARPGVRVVRNAERRGKVAGLLDAMQTLDADAVVTIDCDVATTAAAIEAVLEETRRSDLVLANALPLEFNRSFWERGAAFSALRHARLRDEMLDRYPALCTNGRLLGMSRRMVTAILESSVPRHTEDAHFMLVCLNAGFSYALRSDAVVRFRAPQTISDYLKQTDRYAQGRELLEQRWPQADLAKYYDLRAWDALRTALEQAVADPWGAFAFGALLAAKTLRRGEHIERGAWPVAATTKVLR